MNKHVLYSAGDWILQMNAGRAPYSRATDPCKAAFKAVISKVLQNREVGFGKLTTARSVLDVQLAFWHACNLNHLFVQNVIAQTISFPEHLTPERMANELGSAFSRVFETLQLRDVTLSDSPTANKVSLLYMVLPTLTAEEANLLVRVPLEIAIYTHPWIVPSCVDRWPYWLFHAPLQEN